MNLRNFNIFALFIVFLLNIGSVFASVEEDTEITAAVKANLIMAKDIPAKDIQVTTKDKIVEFVGTIDTDQQAKRVLEATDGVKGIVGIKADGLKVKASSSAFSDMLLTANAKIKISWLTLEGTIASGNSLTVETTNKIVHISGTVRKEEDINTVVEAVRSIKDVKDVKHSIVSKG